MRYAHSPLINHGMMVYDWVSYAHSPLVYHGMMGYDWTHSLVPISSQNVLFSCSFGVSYAHSPLMEHDMMGYDWMHSWYAAECLKTQLVLRIAEELFVQSLTQAL